ncbi:MAG: type II secretion system protein [Phycisphaerales bacterium]|nr:type II secretion system protein [Phycisphaerales bacterium]
MKRRTVRAFSILEILIALAISVVLLTATMMALRASFETYRRSAERVSTNVAGRLIIERAQMMIRGGVDFLPLPSSPSGGVLESDFLSIQSANGAWTTLRWDQFTETIRWEDGVDSWSMLDGVTQSVSGQIVPLSPFRLSFRDGRWLTHATIDLVVSADGVTTTDLDLEDVPEMRFVGSAMPRRVAWSE